VAFVILVDHGFEARNLALIFFDAASGLVEKGGDILSKLVSVISSAYSLERVFKFFEVALYLKQLLLDLFRLVLPSLA